MFDGYRRVDNITDAALAAYREAFGPEVTKDDIFDYVYGVLHSPQYRERFAADLKKMLPRIPLAATTEDFRAFVAAGARPDGSAHRLRDRSNPTRWTKW